MNQKQSDVLLKQIRKCCTASAESHARLQQLEEVASALLGPPAKLPKQESERVDFPARFVAGLTHLNLRDHEVATALGVSRATVTRWRQGKIIPPLLMRQHVLAWLKSRLEE